MYIPKDFDGPKDFSVWVVGVGEDEGCWEPRFKIGGSGRGLARGFISSLEHEYLIDSLESLQEWVCERRFGSVCLIKRLIKSRLCGARDA